MSNVTAFETDAGAALSAPAGDSNSNTIARQPTYWGYVLRQSPLSRGIAAIAEAASLFAGIVLVVVAVGQWFLPMGETGAEVIAIKAVFSLICIMAGWLLYHFGARGLVQELQVDTSHRELRVVFRNRNGVARMSSALGFDEIGSLFIEVVDEKSGAANLCARHARTQLSGTLLSGPAQELEVILPKLEADLAAPRKEPRLPKTARAEPLAAQ